jgi:hypothetical protein
LAFSAAIHGYGAARVTTEDKHEPIVQIYGENNFKSEIGETIENKIKVLFGA